MNNYCYSRTLDNGDNYNTNLTGINDAGTIVGANFVRRFAAAWLCRVSQRTSADGATCLYAGRGEPQGLASRTDVGGILVISSPELQALINFSNAQHAFGQQIGVMDPVAYTYEALGAALSGSQRFSHDAVWAQKTMQLSSLTPIRRHRSYWHCRPTPSLHQPAAFCGDFVHRRRYFQPGPVLAAQYLERCLP